MLLRQAILARCDFNVPQDRVAVEQPHVNAPIFEVHDANYCCGLSFYELRLLCDVAVALIPHLILSCERTTCCKARMTFMRITLDEEEWLE